MKYIVKAPVTLVLTLVTLVDVILLMLKYTVVNASTVQPGKMDPLCRGSFICTTRLGSVKLYETLSSNSRAVTSALAISPDESSLIPRRGIDRIGDQCRNTSRYPAHEHSPRPRNLMDSWSSDLQILSGFLYGSYRLAPTFGALFRTAELSADMISSSSPEDNAVCRGDR
jgi:hypothetical protein